MRFIRVLTMALALAVVSSAQFVSQLGTMAHFQSGGGWRTTFYLFNTGQTISNVQLDFYDDNGNALPIPLRLTQVGRAITYDPAAEFKYGLPAGSVLEVESDWDDPTGVGLKGWANLQGGSNITGFLIFRYAGSNGSGVQEAVSPLETRSGKSYVLNFDNTNQHFTSFALTNITTQTVNVTVTARDAVSGEPLAASTIVPLPPRGHEARLISDLIASTTGRSGTVEFSTITAGQISVLGLRFTQSGPGTYAFTSVPPIMKQ